MFPYIFLFIFGIIHSFPKPVRLNAVYKFDGKLNPTYGMYYGSQSISMFRVEFNFNTNHLIFFENSDFGMDGLDCDIANGCVESKYTEEMLYPHGLRMIDTTKSTLALMLPQIPEINPLNSDYVEFNLYKSKTLKIQNIIGLNPKSLFWEFISKKYDAPFYNLKFNSEFFMKNSMEIKDNPDSIKSTIDLFLEPNSAVGYKEEMINKISFSNVKMKFGDKLNTNKEPFFSYNSEYIFRVNKVEYQAFVNQLKSEICIDQSHCEDSTDVFGNMSGNSKLVFVFPNSDELSEKREPFQVEFFSNELFYFDLHNKLCFNFDFFVSNDVASRSTDLEFGLLFLKMVELELGYFSPIKKLVLYIRNREFKNKSVVYHTYLIVSFLFSIFIVTLIFLFMKPTSKFSESSYRSSFF